MLKKLRRRLGRLISGQSHANTATFFECLLKLGFEPRHIVDIGAHKGGWTRTSLHYFPAAHYTLFEPQRELLESQADLDLPNITKIYIGAGPASGRQSFTTHERADSYSFAWTMEEAELSGQHQVEMDVVSLDDFLVNLEIPLPPPDVVKIDAEGWDLEVLAGAEETITKAKVVLIEAGVMNKRFRNTVHEVVNEMASRDFVLFDITDLNRTARDGALWNVELAFVRKSGPLDIAVDRYG